MFFFLFFEFVTKTKTKKKRMPKTRQQNQRKEDALLTFSVKPLASEKELHEVLNDFHLKDNVQYLDTAWEAYKYARHHVKEQKANSNMGKFNQILAEKKRNLKKLEKLSNDDNADQESIQELENQIHQNDKKMKTLYDRKLTPEEKAVADKKMSKLPLSQQRQQQMEDDDDADEEAEAEETQQPQSKTALEYKKKYETLKEKYRRLQEEYDRLKNQIKEDAS